MKTALFASLAGVIALLTAGCGTQPEPAASVHFGAILSLTGPAAPYGKDNQTGLELAREVINASGGIKGKSVELDVQDSAGESEQAIALARRFAADAHVVAILGPTRTGSTVAVSKLLPELKIPMISVGSTGDWKSAAGTFNPWTFRSTRVDTYLIPPLLRAAKTRLGITRVAIIYTADDDWSASTLKVYEKEIPAAGLQLVAKESQMTADTDRSAQLTKIAAAHPDALIINTLSSDAPTVAAQARRRGITARFLGTAGFTNPETWKLAGPGVLDGTVLAENFYPQNPRETVKSFVSKYVAKYGKEPPPYAAYAYDGLMLIADACRRSSNLLDRNEVRDKLASTKGFEGALGVLTYEGSGDALKTPFMLQIAGDQFKLLPE